MLFRRVLSFQRLGEWWRAEAAKANGIRAEHAADLVARLDRAPELERPITDLSVVDRHRDLIDALMQAVFPVAYEDEVFAVASIPFELTPVWSTPGFERLGLLDRLRTQLLAGEMKVNRAVVAWNWVLSTHYGKGLAFATPLALHATDPTTGLERAFRLQIDGRFCEAVVVGDLPRLSQVDIDRLLTDPFDIDRWQQALPLDRFELRGFSLFNATDVTAQNAVAALTSQLIRPDAMATREQVDMLRSHLRAMLQLPDIELGLIRIERDDQDAITGAQPAGRSLLLQGGSAPYCCQPGASHYMQVIEKKQPIWVRDLGCCTTVTEHEQHVMAQGIRNLFIAPLISDDRLVGLIELGSPHPGDLHALNAGRLQEVLGLFATAMRRVINDRETRLQAVIKQQYTAIHPAVEWRFRSAARNWVDAAASGAYTAAERIVFDDVYPLYGLSDIRGSSGHRARAIQDDLLLQLDLARQAIGHAAAAKPLPVLAELSHRINGYARDVASDLKAGDELRVLDFLRGELEDTLRQVESFGGDVAARIADYHAALDPQLGFLYRRRRDFEHTVTLINDTISAFLDREERAAQEMFPHYFEKYKTDGVDYNIYVGASLQEDGSFAPIYLRNLRIWQLMMMCGIVWEIERIRPRMTTPLDVAHLLLVQSSPLAIRFDADEKQFDVDGAYNIRYEIVKKRIDKAWVRGRREQLTQPGRIAIVYSHEREAAEYREYIEFLQSRGYITDPIEHLELEDLQGASGLQAIRVTVAPTPVDPTTPQLQAPERESAPIPVS
jgi:hypothetical protein